MKMKATGKIEVISKECYQGYMYQEGRSPYLDQPEKEN